MKPLSLFGADEVEVSWFIVSTDDTSDIYVAITFYNVYSKRSST